MPDLVIIADDLTGALDASAPFATLAGGVVAASAPDHLPKALAAGASVVAVSTRSREIPPEAARARVAAVLAALPPGTRAFKKVDSRLKGHLAEELAPFGDAPLLVAPAIPEAGRVARGGAVAGFGVETPIPIAPLLGAAAARAAIPETETPEDLDRALAAAAPGAVLVGASGLARALARSMGAGAPVVDPVLPGPVCVVIGSTDPITLAQIDGLLRARPDFRHLAAPSGAVPPEAPGGDTLIQAVPGPDRPRADAAAALTEGATPHALAAASVIAAGGMTAEALLDAMGLGVLTVVGEALPGMPLCRAGGRSIVTKSGGFGAPDALIRLCGA